MTSIAPSLRELFVQFRSECEWIQRCYNTYRDLWEAGDCRLDLMRVAAPGFFNDVNRLLIEQLYLRVCMITDPATSRVAGMARANLTCHFLNGELTKAGKITGEIEALSLDLIRLRDFVLPARNRLLAHLDVEQVLSGQDDLGAHPEQEAGLFFSAMQDYCDAVGWAVDEGPLDFSGIGRGPGDVVDLLRLVELGLKAKGAQA